MTRAAKWTAMPPTSSPRSWTSPVWTPARIWTPPPRSRSRRAVAQRMARPGRSNRARMPSPVDLTSRPWSWPTSSRATRSWVSSSSAQRRSPTSRARSVEPTMSVNSTVARARSPASVGGAGGGDLRDGPSMNTTPACRARGISSSSISRPGQNAVSMPWERSAISQMPLVRTPTSAKAPAWSCSQRRRRSPPGLTTRSVRNRCGDRSASGRLTELRSPGLKEPRAIAPRSVPPLAGPLGGAAAGGGVQDPLAQPQLGRGDLDQLVGADPLDGLLQRQDGGRDQPDGLVRGVGADVGLLLLAGRVDVDVLGAGVLADDHALVHLGAGADEQLAPLLELPEGIPGGGPDPVGDQGAVDPVVDRPGPVVVAVEQVVEDGRAPGRGEQAGAEADQAPGRHPELQAYPAGAVVDHVGHPPPAQGQALGDDADELLGHVEGDRLVRLLEPPVDGAGDDLGPRHLQLVALAPGLLDQHGQLELAPALDLEGVGRGGRDHPDGHVAEDLAVQAVLEVAAGQVGAVAAGERRGVDPEAHGDAGLVDGH